MASRIFVAVLAIVASTAVVRADTYPRQAGVDAAHYIFRLELSDTSPEIVAEATVDLLFTQDGIASVALDLASMANGKGMTVSAVTSGTTRVVYTHYNSVLTLTPPSPSRAGRHETFTIAYRGAPAGGLRMLPNKYGEWSAFSENWPNHARDWLPTIDHPSDKATSEFIVTVPAKYKVVANGLLQDEVALGDGRTQSHWKQSVPIASWLNAIGVEQFAVHHAGEVKGIALSTWVAHQDDDAGRLYFEAPARQAIEFFSDRVGAYPYEKLANVAAAGLNGGTEHASAIFYGETGVKPFPGTNLVAHEIAHQWFGDSVTESDWDDVWLSEGFATYFTLLFTEHYSGRDAFVAGLQSSRTRAIATEKSLPGISVIHRNLADMRQVLNQLVYQKGGWVLHMLRGTIGTDPFWAGIREYYARYRDRNASTADLRRVMEGVSKQDLSWFFDEWLTRPESPSFEGGWRYDAAAKQIEIEVNQTQNGDAYRMPLEIGIVAAGSPQPRARIERVEMKTKQNRFVIPADAPPADVTFDPNTWLLMDRVTFQKRP
jgi:aminopeptidase N